MNNGRRIGLIMIITGATLWGLSGPMIQWLFQHTNVSSIDFLTIRLLLAGIFILSFLLIKKQNIFQIWKHPRYSIQLIIFSILGMLGAQYAFIETVHISNAVTATLFQFRRGVLHALRRESRCPRCRDGHRHHSGDRPRVGSAFCGTARFQRLDVEERPDHLCGGQPRRHPRCVRVKGHRLQHAAQAPDRN